MQKITLTSETRRCINPNTFLGYEGENNANRLIFEFTDGFIDGLAVLKVERGETKGTIDLVKANETYELEVKSSLLAVQGDIKFQFVITEPNGTIIKYDPFIMTVKDAIDADGELPEEYPSWQEIIATELAKVEEATENANKVAEELLLAKENGEFNGRDGEDGIGKDGISPDVTTEQTPNGTKITITDAKGTQTVEVLNGKDGKDGKDGTMSFEDLTEDQKASLKGDDGADGYSPIANVAQTSTGAIITVTDKNGTTTATVYNGKDGQDGKDGVGEKGDPGEPGQPGQPGEPGKDGLTPHIGDNGNWWIGEEDTGVNASGGVTQTVLKEINEEYTTNGADEFVSLNKYYSLDDSIYNYDYLLVNWYCKSSSNAHRMPATPIVVDVSTIRKVGFPYQIRANLNLSNNTETNDISMEFQSETQLRWMQVRGTYAKIGIFNVCGVKLNSNGNSSGTSNTPIGTIISYMGMVAPNGYLVCDGSTLNISDYPALASHFETQFGTKNHFGGDGSATFALPDLRNEFLRGYGDISGEVGQHQDATQIANYRSYSDNNNGLFYIPAKQNYNQGGANADERIATTSEVHKFTTTALQSDSGTLTYYSARPTNVAVLFCIKY